MKIAIIGLAALAGGLALSTAASAGECRDPWVTTAIYEATGHKPRGSGESLDCNIRLYGGGQWSDYPDLFRKVKASYRDPQPSAGIAGNASAALAGQNAGVGVAARPGGAGRLVGNDGASMVAAGGGNMVAAGGGN